MGLGEGLNGHEDVGVRSRRLHGTEFGDGEGDCGHQLLVRMNDVRRDFFVEQGRVGGERAAVLILIAVSSEQVGAVDGAVEGDFALRSTANGADFFTFGGAEARGFAFFADRAGHTVSQ
jgi:hypothetical protein